MRDKAPKHGRIKPKYNPGPNTAEKAYHDEIRKLGCLVCGAMPSIHHVSAKTGPRRSHYRVVPLCPVHHQGTHGYHGLGSDRLFTKTYGINLYEKAIELNEQYSAIGFI